MDMNRKAHPDCKYFANPFHECASDCLEKIAQRSGKKQASKIPSLPGSFGKKKTESQRPSPLNTRRHHHNTAANSPKVHQSRPSPVAVKNTTVPETKKTLTSVSSDEISIDLNVQGASFNHIPEKRSPNPMADLNKAVTLKPEEHENNGKKGTVGEISVFNDLSPPRSYANDDDDDDDDENNDENGIELDLESVMSGSCVSVGNYRVNSGVSTVLQSIIDKHGDIAANCSLESASMRSRYLECLCSLMQELGSTPVRKLTELKVKEMLAVLKDLETVNIDVAWLRSVLEEFARHQENTDSERERQESSVRSKKQELETQEADLARIEKEVTEARLKVEEMKAELVALETEQSRREEMGFKVEKFKGKSFLDELL